MTTAVQILEYVTTPAGSLKVDREAGVIRGVKILGWKSANGREYLPEGVSPGLYEGRAVNANHPAKAGDSRSAYDRFGRTVNVTAKPDGLWGDLEYLKAHPLAGPVCEAAERMPNLFGLSHNARGREKKGSKGTVIEAVESVQSVDLVAEPATVGGLFEGAPMKTTIKAYLESVKALPGWKASRGLVFLTELDASGMGDAPMDAPAAPVTAGATDSDGALSAAFRAAINKVLDDDSLDIKGKVKKIGDILKMEEKLLASEDAPPPGGDGGADEATESKRAAAGADAKQLREELAVRDLIEEAGVKFAKTESRRAFIKSLVPLAEGERKALIEERKAAAPAADAQAGNGKGKPKSAPPAYTAPKTLQEAKLPDKAADWAKSCLVE